MSADTIAALATAPGKAGVAVVRVSGPEAFALAEKLTHRPVSPGRITCRKLYRLSPPPTTNSLPIDDAVVLAFKGPNSYTGEDVVEFQCHGGSVTPRRVLEACFAAGARLARRGEFTERAFLNGRIDLSEAEAVIDLIDAKTEAAADDALAHMGGERKRRYRALYDQAVSLSSELEHSLDIDESDLSEEFLAHLHSSLFTLHSSLQKAIEQEKQSVRLKDGFLVVLAGLPNAGKSSLLNALLGEARAIVSDIPGTTRDSIEAWTDLGGIPVRLVDTAGLRGTSDAVEAEGVRRAEGLIARADVVLMLSESGEAESLPLLNKDISNSSYSGGRDSSAPEIIRIRSKSDLQKTSSGCRASGSELNVSAKTGEGLDELRALLAARLVELEPRQNGRGLDLLIAACDELSAFVSPSPLTPHPPPLTPHSSFLISHSSFSADPVIAADAVRNAAEMLGKLIGATYSDDLLDALFSRFCVGK